MGDWKADKEATVGDDADQESYLSHKLYLWIVPPGRGN
jgi:hypothetical protein